MHRALLVAFVLLASGSAALARTTIVTAGAVGDSSTFGPVAEIRQISGTGDVRALSVSGWQIAFTRETRTTPSSRRVVSLALTPRAANNSDHIFVDGERRRDLSFRDTRLEASFGRVDFISERWSSDARAVILYEHPTGVDAATERTWQYPYAGIRARQAWNHITAENPFLLTFRGSEVAAETEVFGGRELWTRIAIGQRSGDTFGRFGLAERVEIMAGSRLDNVNAFLVGGSWPISGMHTLYGYRYGEFRVDRAASATGDVSYRIHDSMVIAAHVSAMRGRDLSARGVAVDVSRSWGGVGVRFGVGFPFGNSEDRSSVAYLSLFGARFR